MIISRGILLKLKIVQTEVVQKFKTQMLCSVTFSENHAVYEIMWKNMVEPDRPEVSI
jgi:hypothetical protein